MTKVSIIIPVWNLWDITLQCLKSIATTCSAEILSKKIEVIVVNNGSDDETVAALAPALQNLFGDCGKSITLHKNLGFAKACNAGAKVAKHPLLFFLNNDTILTENWLPPLVFTLNSNPKLGMVGPLLLYPDETVQHCGICATPTGKVTHLYHKFPAKHPLVNKQRFLQAITGAAFLVPSNLFMECEGFHKDYINGFEDIDFCYTVRRKGFYLTCVPQSRIYHITSQTLGRFDHEQQNTALFFMRNKTQFTPDLHTFLVKDGYIPKLSQTLELYATINESRKEYLAQAMGFNYDLEKCCNLLQEEPLWIEGLKLNAIHYAKQQNWEKAAAIWTDIFNFHPLLDYIVKTKEMATLAKIPSLLNKTTRIEQGLCEILMNPMQLQNGALQLKKMAIRDKDAPLVNLVENWFLENCNSSI